MLGSAGSAAGSAGVESWDDAADAGAGADADAGGAGPKLGPKPYRKRSLCYRARAPAGPAAHRLAQRREDSSSLVFIMACGLRSDSIFALS